LSLTAADVLGPEAERHGAGGQALTSLCTMHS
jgi:hypothetical protein